MKTPATAVQLLLPEVGGTRAARAGLRAPGFALSAEHRHRGDLGAHPPPPAIGPCVRLEAALSLSKSGIAPLILDRRPFSYGIRL